MSSLSVTLTRINHHTAKVSDQNFSMLFKYSQGWQVMCKCAQTLSVMLTSSQAVNESSERETNTKWSQHKGFNPRISSVCALNMS